MSITRQLPSPRFRAVAYREITGYGTLFLITSPNDLKGVVITRVTASRCTKISTIVGYSDSLTSPLKSLTSEERAMYEKLCEPYTKRPYVDDV